jgi:hypothetical protein
VDHPVFHHRVGFVSDAGEERFAAGVGGIHVAVEHQVAPAAAAFMSCNDISAPILDFLANDAQPHFLPAALHIVAHRQFFTGGTGDVDDLGGHGDDVVFAHLGNDALGDIVRQLRGFDHGLGHTPVPAEKTRKSSG